MRRAVFLGRFQRFHEGHHRVVSEYKNGVRSRHRPRYPREIPHRGKPLTADERKYILRGSHQDIDVVRVPDEDRGEAGNPVWAERFVDRTDAEGATEAADSASVDMETAEQLAELVDGSGHKRAVPPTASMLNRSPLG